MTGRRQEQTGKQQASDRRATRYHAGQQGSYREATGRRQGIDRKTAGKGQEGDREVTGRSDRTATGRNNRRVTGEQQKGTRQKVACHQELTGSNKSDRIASGGRQESDREAAGERHKSEEGATSK